MAITQESFNSFQDRPNRYRTIWVYRVAFDEEHPNVLAKSK